MKYARPSSFDVADDEVICLKPKKSDKKRTVVRPRKYHKLELHYNDLHDFNDILKEDQ